MLCSNEGRPLRVARLGREEAAPVSELIDQRCGLSVHSGMCDMYPKGSGSWSFMHKNKVTRRMESAAERPIRFLDTKAVRVQALKWTYWQVQKGGAERFRRAAGDVCAETNLAVSEEELEPVLKKLWQRFEAEAGKADGKTVLPAVGPTATPKPHRSPRAPDAAPRQRTAATCSPVSQRSPTPQSEPPPVDKVVERLFNDDLDQRRRKLKSLEEAMYGDDGQAHLPMLDAETCERMVSRLSPSKEAQEAKNKKLVNRAYTYAKARRLSRSRASGLIERLFRSDVAQRQSKMAQMREAAYKEEGGHAISPPALEEHIARLHDEGGCKQHNGDGHAFTPGKPKKISSQEGVVLTQRLCKPKLRDFSSHPAYFATHGI